MKIKSLSEEEKQKRLYTEFRFARDSTLSLPKTSVIFRLKEKYRPLPAKIFARNFKVYLDKVSSNTSVTWQDFMEALTVLKQQ